MDSLATSFRLLFLSLFGSLFVHSRWLSPAEVGIGVQRNELLSSFGDDDDYNGDARKQKERAKKAFDLPTKNCDMRRMLVAQKVIGCVVKLRR